MMPSRPARGDRVPVGSVMLGAPLDDPATDVRRPAAASVLPRPANAGATAGSPPDARGPPMRTMAHADGRPARLRPDADPRPEPGRDVHLRPERWAGRRAGQARPVRHRR